MNSPDHAEVLAPAPLIYSAAFLAGLAADFALPAAAMPDALSIGLGTVVIAISVPIVLSAVRALARGQTAFDARKSTKTIVTDGAFAYIPEIPPISRSRCFTSVWPCFFVRIGYCSWPYPPS
jgi:hypothetical protein